MFVAVTLLVLYNAQLCSFGSTNKLHVLLLCSCLYVR